MSEKLSAAMRAVGSHIDAIEREVFKRGAGMKFTFIARDPSNPEADFLVSDDDLVEVAELIARSVKREEVAAQGAAHG